jgi:hypothetical protein
MRSVRDRSLLAQSPAQSPTPRIFPSLLGRLRGLFLQILLDRYFGSYLSILLDGQHRGLPHRIAGGSHARGSRGGGHGCRLASVEGLGGVRAWRKKGRAESLRRRLSPGCCWRRRYLPRGPGSRCRGHILASRNRLPRHRRQPKPTAWRRPMPNSPPAPRLRWWPPRTHSPSNRSRRSFNLPCRRPCRRNGSPCPSRRAQPPCRRSPTLSGRSPRQPLRFQLRFQLRRQSRRRQPLRWRRRPVSPRRLLRRPAHSLSHPRCSRE